MLDRITRQQVERVAASVSDLLPVGVAVAVQGRNGGFGLDLLHSDSVMRTLRFGTKREVLEYLQGMRDGLFLQRDGSAV